MGIERLREWELAHPNPPVVPAIYKRETYAWSAIEPAPAKIIFENLKKAPVPKGAKVRRFIQPMGRYRRVADEELVYAIEHLDHGEAPDPRIYSLGKEGVRYYEIPEAFQVEVITDELEATERGFAPPDEAPFGDIDERN